jgi:nitric oxide reductase large subunit
MQSDVMQTFRWLRVAGDTPFAAGAVALPAFVIGVADVRQPSAAASL